MTRDWMFDLIIDGNREGPTVVLGHSLGSSHEMWDAVVKELRDDLRVVRYDLPGHGGTPDAPVGGSLTMGDLAGALVRSLKEKDIDKFHVGGLSLGGMVAMYVAEHDQPDVESLMVMSAGPVNGTPQQWQDKATQVLKSGTSSLVDATFDRWFMPSFRDGKGSEAVREIRDIYENCSDKGYAQCCEVLASTDMRPGLPSIIAPTLLIAAEEDAALNWDAADRLAKTLLGENVREVSVVKIRDARHMSAVEKPSEVASAIKDFILGFQG